MARGLCQFFWHWLEVKPTLVLCDRESNDAHIPFVTCVLESEAERTDSSRFLISLGLPCGTPKLKPLAECAPLTAQVAPRVCHMLLHGTLMERLNAAYVLHRHVHGDGDGAVPDRSGVLAPATLDALCITAVSRLYVPPLDADLRDEFDPKQLRDVVVANGTLPSSSTVDDVCRGMFSCLQALALDALWNALCEVVHGADTAARVVAMRRVYQLKVHTAALELAHSDYHGTVAELRPVVRCVALLALANILSCSLAMQSPPKEQAKLIEDARVVALETLADQRSGRHLRAAAVWLLSTVVSPPPGKVQALKAGALQHCMDIYSATTVYCPVVRMNALLAAGNMSYAAWNKAMVEPHVEYCFAQVRRFAAQPSLLDPPTPDDEETAEEEINLLYRVLFALGQVALHVEFRETFHLDVNLRACSAVMDAVGKRKHTHHIYDMMEKHVLSRLLLPACARFSVDVSHLNVVVSTERTAIGSTPLRFYNGAGKHHAPAAGEAQCAACSARGMHFKLCAACRTASYCGPECQRAAWKGHKVACRAAVAAREHATLVNLPGDVSEAKLHETAKKLQARGGKQATRP